MLDLSEATEIRERVVAAARALEPSLLGLGSAVRMLREATAIKNAAATMEALLAKRVADGGGWRRSGGPLG